MEVRDICGNIFTLLPILTESFTVYQQPGANAGSEAFEGPLFTDLNAIPSIGTGTWSQVSGPGTITFAPDVNTPSVTATADTYGAYVVRWTEVNGVCSSSSDITVSYEKIAAAGSAQNLCGTLLAVMAGNTPAAGTGTWTKVSGLGTVTFSPNANTPGATATVSDYGTYVLKWTIANGIFCSTDENVTITFEKAADAGTEQHLCGTFAATLAGNTPAVGSGTWSLVSGPAGVTFTPTINTPDATATVTQYGTYIFKWTVENGAFCTTNNDVTVVYNPSGQVEQPSDQVLCNGNNTVEVNFSTTNIGGTTTYNWTNSAPGIGLAASGSGDLLSFTASNTGTAPVVATIGVTPVYSDGVVDCPGPAKNFTFTVNPTAQVDQPSNQVVCNNSATTAINFTTTNTVGTTTYSWSNDDPSIGLGAGGTGNIPSFTAVNTGLVPVTATITVDPAFSYGSVSCTGTSKIFTITVNPTGQVTQPLNTVICNNSTATVDFTTVNGGGTTSYSWTNNNTGIGLAASGTDISFTGTNAGTWPITGTITVTPTFTNGGTSCPGPAKIFTITVNPTGQVVQPADLIVCNGSPGSVTFATLNSGGTTSYAWTNINTDIGLGADGTGNIAFIAVNTNTFPISATITVTPTFNFGSRDCTGPSKTFTITVNPTPVLTSSLTPPDVCSNTLFSYTPSSLTAGTTFNWNRAVVAGITPAGPTSGIDNPNETLVNITNIPIGVTYQYTLTAGVCSNIQNVIVNIKPEPVIVPGQTSDLCSGNATNYHINLENFINPVDGVVFTWLAPVLDPVDPDFTGGSERSSASAANIADIFTNTMGVDGTATYLVTPYIDLCAGTPESIVLTIRSQPVLDASLDKTVCSNTGIVLSVASSSVAAASYNIELITVDANLTADAANATVGTGLSADAIQHDIFTNTSSLAATVVYDIVPVSAAGCAGDMKQITHTVYPEPVMTTGLTETVCSGAYTSLALSITNGVAGTNFNWVAPTNTGGMTGGTAGPSTYISDIFDNTSGSTQTATYKVVPISGFGCIGDTTDVVITVNSNPVADINSGPDTILVCGGHDLQLDGNPSGGSGTYSSHLWSGMVGPLDNSSIQTPVFNYSLNGEFNLTYTVIDDNGCLGSDAVVVVNDNPNALFSVDNNSDCSPLTTTFTNNSANAVSYEWTFGDGSPTETTTDVNHEFVNQTISIQYYSVKLVTQSVNGCSDSMTQVITVYPEVDSEFSLTPDTVCHGATATLAAQPGGSTYFWDYGDGDSEYTGNVANHVFRNTTNGPVTYTVTLTAESFYACSSSSQKEVVVYPSPVAAFVATPANQVFPNATVTITDLTNSGNWDYLYDFGDSTTSVEANPEHTYGYPGTYKISLTVSNEKCSDDASGYITITPTPPVANFDEVESGCMPWTVTLNNTSQFADTYYWDFGDGSSSTSENPTYTYYEAGAFVVRLIVKGAGGIDEFTRVVESYQTPNSYLNVIPKLVYVNDESIRCLNLSEDADSWVWEFGDGDTSHLFEPFHKYMEEGVFDVTLHSYTDEGCSDTYILSPAVTVEPAGELQFATAFRPKPDGPPGGDIPTGEDINTVFFPPIKEMVDEYELQIFNRWGERIFVSNDINFGWDGYYKGKLAKQDVYIWKVTGKYVNGKPFSKVGDITLLH